MGLIVVWYSCGHISALREPIPTKFGLWMYLIMFHLYDGTQNAEIQKKIVLSSILYSIGVANYSPVWVHVRLCECSLLCLIPKCSSICVHVGWNEWPYNYGCNISAWLEWSNSSREFHVELLSWREKQKHNSRTYLVLISPCNCKENFF